MTDLAMVMPMAGRGSRFSVSGEMLPKPLIEIGDRPFFWWAAESLLRATPVAEMVFVVLAEHVAAYDIDARIARYYPQARIVVIAETTEGAAETAAIGVAALHGSGPIAINDCDHAFAAPALGDLVERLASGAAGGGLVGFASDDPAYSYVRLADEDPSRIVATVEKRCAGPFAIAGCYLFGSAAIFRSAMARYRDSCPYPELFLSGLYNILCADGNSVRFAPLAGHLSFGTPEELSRVSPQALSRLIGTSGL